MKSKFTDLLKKAKRGPQVILLKDAALMAAYSGLESGDKVVDAGAGSGWLASYLARIVAPKGKVVTYERRKEFINIAKENFKLFNLTNIKIKNKDIYEGISERNLDLITLDLQEPWRLIPHAEKALRQGGYLAVYSPQITQVIEFANKLGKSKLRIEKVVEVLERSWKVEGKVARPEFHMLGHTGFLTFARKQ